MGNDYIKPLYDNVQQTCSVNYLVYDSHFPLHIYLGCKSGEGNFEMGGWSVSLLPTQVELKFPVHIHREKILFIEYFIICSELRWYLYRQHTIGNDFRFHFNLFDTDRAVQVCATASMEEKPQSKIARGRRGNGSECKYCTCAEGTVQYEQLMVWICTNVP